MSTAIRPELSSKNKYYLPRHRYYELKHFCLQYQDMVHQIAVLRTKLYSICGSQLTVVPNTNKNSSARFEEVAIEMQKLVDGVQLIKEVAKEADSELCEYLLEGVTRGCTYDYLSTMKDIPCCRDTYYDRYRKFFYILDKKK